MAEAIRGLFSSRPSLDRVNILGLIVLLISVLVAALAGRLAKLFPEERREGAKIGFKLLSLGICIVGVIIAIY
jgi:hypothetical protein